MVDERLAGKILKYIKENDECTEAQLRNSLEINKNDFDKNLSFCKKNKYFECSIHSNPNTLMITGKGLSFLDKYTYKHTLFDNKQLLKWLVSFIITLVAVYIAFSLNSPYLEANKPTLIVYPNYLEMPRDSILPELSIKNLNVTQGYGDALKLCVQNEGKKDSGRIKLFVDSGRLASEVESIDSLPNKEGAHSQCTILYVRDNECYLNNRCNPETLPKGKTALEITIEYQNYRINKSIDVCIWHERINECRGHI